MSEPTEREWLEGIGEQFEREHENSRVTVRVEVVTPCEHGDYREPHDRTHAVKRDDLLDLDGRPLPATWVYTNERCPGGFARSFTEWPPEAIEAAARAVWERNYDGNWFQDKQLCTGSYLKAKHDAKSALAAAWGHITGDKETQE